MQETEVKRVKLPRAEIIAQLETIWGPDCFLCDNSFGPDETKTIDHWYPQWWCKQQGWSTEKIWDISNLRLMHKKCNAAKGEKVPNADGSLPDLKKPKSLNERRADRSNRTPVCPVCDSGRKLGPEDECRSCGSGPMPATFPRWAKVDRSSDCPHEGVWWCWACSIGVTPRAQPAFVYVLDGEYLD